jgi:hypothetical protein
MAGALLRRLIVRDHSFVSVGVCLYGAVEFGKVETGTRHSASKMVAEMPVLCAAKMTALTSLRSDRPLPRSAAATPSLVSRPM